MPAFALTPMGPCSPSPFGIHPSCTLASPPSLHFLHTCDSWCGFSAESYVTVECFTLEVNPAARRVRSAPSPSHVAHSPRRVGVVTFPVRQDEHLCRWRFHRGVRFLAPTLMHDYCFITACFVVFRQRTDSLRKQRLCGSSCSLSAVAAAARASLSAAGKTIARQTPRVCCKYAIPP